MTFPLLATAQETGKVHYNIGMKAGFQAVTYNDPDFGIDGYCFDTNNIQSTRTTLTGRGVFSPLTESHGDVETLGFTSSSVFILYAYI